MLMVPTALILVFIVIQAALTFHAKSVITAAAQDYVRAVQIEHPGSGDAAASAALAGSERLFAAPPSIVATETAGTIAVQITASVVSVVPGWAPTVQASVSGPREVFRPTGQP